MALVRVYCGLASAYPPRQLAVGSPSLSATIVDDSGRVLDVCELGDDSYGYAYLSALLAERATGPYSVAIAADSDEKLVPRLLTTAGWAITVVDEESADDCADRFADEVADDPDPAASPAPRRALGLARALQAGALSATLLAPPAELAGLKPVLVAHSALAVGRHATAVALREVLRELYPAALRAYPDPADPVTLAVMDALPEPGALGSAPPGRSRDLAAAADAVTARLAAAGVADQAAVSEAITALRVAIAETPRRSGLSRALTGTVAETVRQSVAAVRACDAATTVLVNALADRVAAPAGAPPARPATEPRPAETPPAETPAPATSRAARRAAARQPEPYQPEPYQPEPYQPEPYQPEPYQPEPYRAGPGPTLPAAAPAPVAPLSPAAPPVAPLSPAAPAGPRREPAPPPPPRRPAVAPAGTRPAPDSAPLYARPSATPVRSAPPAAEWDGRAPAHTRPVSPPPPPPPGITPIAEPRSPVPAGRAGGAPDPGRQVIQVPTPRPAPERPARSSRTDWPTRTPSDDWAVPAPTAAGQPPVRDLPRQRGEPASWSNGGTPTPQRPGGATPPWRADDLRPPAALRLVEPTLPDELRDLGYPSTPSTRPDPPALRLVEPPGNGVPRSIPPVSADDDETLLIFAQTRSAWFDQESGISWESEMDAGWQAAEQAAQPTVGDRTGAGLPRRVPHANLVPGAPPRRDDRQLRVARDPASIAAHTSGYFSGWRRGQEVGGYPLGGRPGRQAAGAWEFHRDEDRLSG